MKMWDTPFRPAMSPTSSRVLFHWLSAQIASLQRVLTNEFKCRSEAISIRMGDCVTSDVVQSSKDKGKDSDSSQTSNLTGRIWKGNYSLFLGTCSNPRLGHSNNHSKKNRNYSTFNLGDLKSLCFEVHQWAVFKTRTVIPFPGWLTGIPIIDYDNLQYIS